MLTFGILGVLLLLFYVMGRCADVVVDNVDIIRKVFGLKMFVAGIVLGFFTSIPEFMISVNALVQGVPSVSLGNLMGGVLVVFGLIFGVSIILNRTIKTDGKLANFSPIFFYLFLPLLFGLDGTISRIDSALIVLWYVWIITYLFHRHQHDEKREPRSAVHPSRMAREFALIGAGLLAIILLSNAIIQLTEVILSAWHIEGFIVGLLLFSLGTNLPEIIVMLRAWRQKKRELSMSHLVGSSLFDPLLIGIFSFMKPYHVTVDFSYYNLMFFTAILFIALMVYYKSDKSFSRSEGVAIVAIYGMFLVSEVSALFIGNLL